MKNKEAPEPKPTKPTARLIHRAPDVSAKARRENALSPELMAVVRGEKLRRAPKPALSDPRPVAMIRGVKNQDARTFFQARVDKLRAADVDELPALLAQATALELWRAGNLADFDALLHVAGLTKTKRTHEVGSVPEFARAAWMRAEVAFQGTKADVRIENGELVLRLPLTEDVALGFEQAARGLKLLFESKERAEDETPEKNARPARRPSPAGEEPRRMRDNDDGPRRNGPPRNGPPRNGPPRNGPPRNGPPRNGPPRDGDRKGRFSR